MILHLNSKAAREVDYAIDEIAAGKIARGVERLCRIRGRELPSLETVARVALSRDIDAVVAAMEVRGLGRIGPDPFRPLPKPRKRIVDKKAIQQYCHDHPRCEVIGCDEYPPCPEPHHLVSRKMRGDDVPSNLLRLCQPHHAEWHRGSHTWAQKHIHALTAEARSKVMTALRLEQV